MAGKTFGSSICLVAVACISSLHAFIDIEELQSINYGIDIINEPTLRAETIPDSAILVTSRFGQQYQCTYPSQTEHKQQKEEEEQTALKIGVIELLKPMEKQSCLLKTKDWWTYELCYGNYIRQYHVEEGKIRGNIIYLGHYESDFDWANETLRESRVRSKIASGRYHSQYYTNGSKCDLTGNGRQTEVRFLCEDGTEDYLARVDEPETCIYVLTVYTSRICKHPHLKSPTPSQPIPISCAPLLSQDEYLLYQSHMEAMKQREEEARARARAELETLEKKRAEAMALKEDEDIEDDLATSVNTILKKSLGKEMTGTSSPETSSHKSHTMRQSGWKIVAGNLDDLDKLLDPQGILSSMSVKNKDDSPKSHTSQQHKGPDKEAEVSKQPSEAEQLREGMEDSDTDLDQEIDEFEKEVERLREKQAMTQKRLRSIKDRVQNAVSSQFKDIIEEAEAEVGAEVNEELALRQLAASLNILMQKLEDTEQEIRDIDKEIDSVASSRADEKKDMDKPKLAEGKEEEEEKPDVQAPPPTKHLNSKLTAGQDEDGRWKVRVRTVTEDEVADDAKSMPDTQQKMLESTLKQGLEKAGLNTDNVKVHVKIIGAKYTGDDDDDTIHVLSEEDSASFQNMIVAILGGNNEAEKEQEQYTKLENNYNFVFDKAAYQDPTSVSSSSDDDSSSSSTNDETVADEEPSLHEEGI